jgi:hypothetical protein
MAYVCGCLAGGAAIILLSALMASLGPIVGLPLWLVGTWGIVVLFRALYRRVTWNP